MHHLYDDILVYPEVKLIALLQLIRQNGNLMNLDSLYIRLISSYLFLEAFDALQKYDYVRLNEKGELLFTAKGEELYRYICRKLGLRGLYKYMMPNITRRIPKKGIEEMYIPKK